MATFGYSFLILIATFIWGTAFVAQIKGNIFGPFTFSSIRCFIAAVFLVVLFKVFDILKKSPLRPRNSEDRKLLWKAGITCGMALALAMNLQQVGLFLGTTAGKSGFLTACYIILVPVISLFLGRRNTLKIWVCVAITTIGLYLLCVDEEQSFQFADTVSLLSAFAFAFHIIFVDKFANRVDPIRLSCIQFLTIGVLTSVPMVIFDLKFSGAEISRTLQLFTNPTAVGSILYAAIFSSGIAYTLQIIAQNKIRPTLASLTMSLESVFAVLAGVIILGEHLNLREIAGCALMLTAIFAAQIRPGHSR